MRSLGAGILLFAVLTGAALAGFCVLRSNGAIAGPSSPLAEIVFGLLPLFHLYLAVVAFRTGRALAPVEAEPQVLPVRLGSGTAGSLRTTTKILAVWSAITIALCFVFLISLYPRSWSESWTCEQTGPGETSCDLIDGTTFQLVLFTLGITNLVLFALGGTAALVVLVRDARRAVAMPPTIVELGTSALLPGVPFDLRLVQHGSEPFQRLGARLVCTESSDYKNGSSTSTATAVAHETIIVQQEQPQAGRTGAVELRVRGKLPPGAMHSYAGANNKIEWALVVTAVSAAGHLHEQSFAVVVPAGRDGRTGA